MYSGIAANKQFSFGNSIDFTRPLRGLVKSITLPKENCLLAAIPLYIMV